MVFKILYLELIYCLFDWFFDWMVRLNSVVASNGRYPIETLVVLFSFLILICQILMYDFQNKSLFKEFK